MAFDYQSIYITKLYLFMLTFRYVTLLLQVQDRIVRYTLVSCDKPLHIFRFLIDWLLFSTVHLLSPKAFIDLTTKNYLAPYQKMPERFYTSLMFTPLGSNGQRPLPKWPHISNATINIHENFQRIKMSFVSWSNNLAFCFKFVKFVSQRKLKKPS